jgi:hypothetical protein
LPEKAASVVKKTFSFMILVGSLLVFGDDLREINPTQPIRTTSAGKFYDFSAVVANREQRWTTNYFIEGTVFWRTNNGTLIKSKQGWDFYWVLESPPNSVGEKMSLLVLPTRSQRLLLPDPQRNKLNDLLTSAARHVDAGTRATLLEGNQGLLRHSAARNWLQTTEVTGGALIAMSPEMRRAVLQEKEQLEWERVHTLLSLAVTSNLFSSFICTKPAISSSTPSNIWRIAPAGLIAPTRRNLP